MEVVTLRALKVLTEARALLSDSANWVQNTPARNRKGTPTDPTSLTACAWCMMGAIHRAAYDAKEPPAVALLAARALASVCAASSLLAPTIVSFNDDRRRTHAEVVAAFDRAIAELRGAAS